MTSKLIPLLKIGVSIGLLLFALMQLDLQETWRQFHQLSAVFVIIALLYYTFLQLLSSWRWQIVLHSTENLASINVLFSSYLVGMFLNNFLPGSLGGDVYRVYRVTQETKDWQATFVSVFLERFSGLAVLSVLAALSLPLAFELLGSWDVIILFVAVVVALVGGVMVLISPKLLNWAEPWLVRLRLGKLAESLARTQTLLLQFAQDRQALAYSLLLSLILDLGIIHYHYLVAQQLQLSISFWQLLVFIPIVSVVTLLPISVGGLGVREGLWIYLFARIGLTSEQAVLLSLIITGLGWLLSLVGGILFLLDESRQQFNNPNLLR
ncbi:lysylphosphatidylglycerol synthase transmembrane domain-containing protein [Crocosphaera sp.]|uniref:lysylphosphatidylglycerol synthase transmembrane domain-containing protein n=1 Tax=Crocosphaera sp. TaxID=2729996 RepID=UPI003F251297|nr:lysylphosphatidylglycerol synthase transmembrane domain-containing protein [Crocosphaera sp.]